MRVSWHPSALPPSHPSFNPLFSLASLLNRETRACILIHVEKVHVFLILLFACPAILLSPRLSTPTVSRFCFWPRYLKEIVPHAVSKFSSYTDKTNEENVGPFEVKTARMWNIMMAVLLMLHTCSLSTPNHFPKLTLFRKGLLSSSELPFTRCRKRWLESICVTISAAKRLSPGIPVCVLWKPCSSEK